MLYRQKIILKLVTHFYKIVGTYCSKAVRWTARVLYCRLRLQSDAFNAVEAWRVIWPSNFSCVSTHPTSDTISVWRLKRASLFVVSLAKHLMGFPALRFRQLALTRGVARECPSPQHRSKFHLRISHLAPLPTRFSSWLLRLTKIGNAPWP